MQVDFYAPHLKISSSLKRKLEQSLQEITAKDPFLLGQKKRQQDAIRAKVVIKKPREFHYFKTDFLHSNGLKRKGSFKLSVTLLFSGQRITATSYGDDLYLLINLVQRKLERKVRRFRNKRIDREEQGARLWKKLRFWTKEHSR